MRSSTGGLNASCSSRKTPCDITATAPRDAERISISDEWDEAGTVHHHPLAGEIPEHEAIAYLIYAWDAAYAGQDRTRPQYIELADRILDCQARFYEHTASR